MKICHFTLEGCGNLVAAHDSIVMPSAAKIQLTDQQQEELERCVASRTLAVRAVERAKIILALAAGHSRALPTGDRHAGQVRFDLRLQFQSEGHGRFHGLVAKDASGQLYLLVEIGELEPAADGFESDRVLQAAGFGQHPLAVGLLRE